MFWLPSRLFGGWLITGRRFRACCWATSRVLRVRPISQVAVAVTATPFQLHHPPSACSTPSPRHSSPALCRGCSTIRTPSQFYTCVTILSISSTHKLSYPRCCLSLSCPQTHWVLWIMYWGLNGFISWWSSSSINVVILAGYCRWWIRVCIICWDFVCGCVAKCVIPHWPLIRSVNLNELTSICYCTHFLFLFFQSHSTP